MTTQTETHRFEAEVQQVLNLVIHSLYTNREIFLRELISNASDALDKLRFEALTRQDLLADGERLGIAIETDEGARVLRVADNGIGMNREDLVENLGTIASSGTRRFLDALRVEGKERGPELPELPDLIGQFGVGFYSCFMVADEITVETRRAGEERGWRWSSRGDGEYTIEEAEGLGRGTVVTLHLRASEEAEGLDELLQEWRIRELVKRYSDFVEYPIQMEVEREEAEADEPAAKLVDASGEPLATGSRRHTVTLNSQRPLWSRPKEEITREEYAELYKHLTHDWHDPLEVVHFRAEGALEYTALLYLPGERPLDLFDPERRGSRLSLYVRRVLIMRECEDLLPVWLRFVRGVVESADLPLNVSRESLQDNPKVRQIRKRLVKKVLESLKVLFAEDRERYERFWRAFGVVLKEGIWFGEDEEQRISGIALFESTRGPGLTSLAAYLERCPEGQDAIYTLAGPSRRALEASPHLEALRARGREVLLLTDPVDEWVLQRLREFGGKPLRAVERGEIELDGEEEKQTREEQQRAQAGLLEALRKALDEEVEEVRFTSRLEESPAVLVSGEHALSAQLERMLRSSGQEVPRQKRILELNPDHAVVGGLEKLFEVDPASPRIADYAALLHGQALLAEGSPLSDPARFSKLVTELMVSAVRG